MATFYVDNALHSAMNATGTATGGGTAHILLQDLGTQADGEFEQYGILLIAGAGAGQQRRIVAYDHSGHPDGERCATVYEAWTVVPDGSTTYEITIGCDRNAGATQGTGATGAWRTVDRAMNAISGAGMGPHTVYVRGGRAYLETATIDTAGQAGRPVTLAGYSQVPGDGGVATLDGQNVRASGLNIAGGGGLYYLLRNLRVIHCTGTGFDLGAATSVRMVHCIAETNAMNGIAVGQDSVLLDCEAVGNAGSGLVAVSSTNVLSTLMVGCSSRGNGVQQIKGGSLVLAFCMACGLPNGNHAISSPSASDGVCLINCTVDGTGSTGATGLYASSSRCLVINTLFSNLRRGIQALTLDPLRLARNNLFFNCLEGNLVNFTSDGHDVLVDPGYLDAVGQDLHLRADSPALRAGYPAHVDIGAVQHCSRSMIGGPCQIGVQA